MRALLVLAVALLVCSAVVGATGGLAVDDASTPEPARLADGPSVAQTDNTSLQQITVLDIPPRSIERWGVDRQYVDLGPAVTLSTNETTDRLQTLAMAERIEAANTTEQRQARIRMAVRELEADVDELDARQTEAVAAYSRGDITSRDLLVDLVRISIAAEELGERRSRLEELAAETPGYDIDRGRVASVGNRLSAFTGPVRAHAEEVLRGDAAPHRFYIATGPESVTVTTIVGDTYYREAYRGDLRNGAGDAIELEVALDIVSTSYPVIWNTTREQTQVFGGGETYPVRIAHSRGDLTAFVDSDARVVYAEHQRRPLDSLVYDRRADRTSEGLRLRVNHTYPGGPVEVNVVDAETGDPVDANVTMRTGTGATRSLERVDEDGTRWTLSPYRRYTITAQYLGDSVEAVIDPGAPPRVKPATANEEGSNETATPTPTPTS